MIQAGLREGRSDFGIFRSQRTGFGMFMPLTVEVGFFMLQLIRFWYCKAPWHHTWQLQDRLLGFCIYQAANHWCSTICGRKRPPWCFNSLNHVVLLVHHQEWVQHSLLHFVIVRPQSNYGILTFSDFRLCFFLHFPTLGYDFFIFSDLTVWDCGIFLTLGIGFFYFQESGYGILTFPDLRAWNFDLFRPQGMGFLHFPTWGYGILTFSNLRVWDFDIFLL